jgi:hypothetical protein
MPRAGPGQRGVLQVRVRTDHGARHAPRFLVRHRPKGATPRKEEAMDHKSSKKAVFTVVQGKEGKSFWVRVGAAFTNSDGSLSVKLDALPTNGQLQVREWEDRDSPGAFQARRAAAGNTELALG